MPTPHRRRLQDALVHLCLLGAGAFAMGPILWAVITSLKELDKVLTMPPGFWPSPATLVNYREVLAGSNMPRYFLNSTVVSLLTILLTLVVGGHGGFAASRYRFPAKNALLFMVLLTVMIPGIATLLPIYSLSISLGMHDTKLVLVLVYTASQLPTVLWLMRGFFDSVPKELDEAALIDGCSPLQVFYRIILPLSQPGMGAAAMVVFVYVWNEFIISLTLTAKDQSRLVPVGVYNYISAFGIEWGRLMAASILALLPVILLFALLQRRFIQGLTAGATKG